jgi:lysophospholipase L1-like esterase
VLEAGGIPYLLVPIRPEWRFPVDRHPTPAGARALAEAVAKALR